MPDGSDLVYLRGGLTLPVGPVLLVLGLEARGFTLRRDGDDILVTPFSGLRDDDKRALRRWKQHVLALLDYVPTEAVQ
jgi:hypothetical protein